MHKKAEAKNYCKNHPNSETTWRCTECGNEFCESCVKPVESYFTKTAICLGCKGRCEDFKAEAEKLQQLEGEARRTKKKVILRYSVFFLLAIPFVLDVIRWLPPFYTTELKFLLLLIAAFWFGPLRNIDIIYKLGSLLYFGWLAHPMLVAALLLGGPSSEMGHLLFRTPIKYLAESILIVISFFITEKISCFISRIYYGKDQIPVSKFGVKGWFLSTFSLTVIISLIIFGVVKLIPEPKEDEVTQIEKLTHKIAKEISRENVDFEKISRLENTIDEKANTLLKENRTEHLNVLLEPYKNMTIDEVWTYYKTGQEKIEKSIEQKFGQYHGARVNEAIQNLFYRELGSYKTVQGIIEKGTPFSKYYLYVHIKYVPHKGTQ